MSALKKIVITGPESSGKTTLTRELALHFATDWVPEYAREYLQALNRPYTQNDLLIIAQNQAKLESQKSTQAKQFLFCDTGLEVIKIWSLVKYKQVDPKIESLLAKCSYDTYLLCEPDLPWEPDPLREHPSQQERWQLFEYYKQALHQSGIPFFHITGHGKRRIEKAISLIEDRRQGSP